MKKAAVIANNTTAFQTLLFFLFTLFSSLLCHTLTRFFISFVQTLIGIFSFQKGTKKHLHVPLLEVHKVFFPFYSFVASCDFQGVFLSTSGNSIISPLNRYVHFHFAVLFPFCLFYFHFS